MRCLEQLSEIKCRKAVNMCLLGRSSRNNCQKGSTASHDCTFVYLVELTDPTLLGLSNIVHLVKPATLIYQKISFLKIAEEARNQSGAAERSPLSPDFNR